MRVLLPFGITTALAYETGLHIGDGSMNYYNNKGLYSLRGNKIKDKLFFDEVVKSLYSSLYHIEVKLRDFGDVYGFQICSDELIEFKKNLGLPLGPKRNIVIPKIILENNLLSLACLRGLIETDGNFYLENKNGALYPRIEFSTTSQSLSKQVCFILSKNNFNFSKWCTEYSNGWLPIHRICIRGYANLQKYIKEVDFFHPFFLQKLALLNDYKS
ncbi:hypothetical protein HUU53_02605 [Candidatus Micrarchaeota archaeon]|nr:hypothetical protein [Candidatus Micrarchaeota archaeon]